MGNCQSYLQERVYEVLMRIYSRKGPWCAEGLCTCFWSLSISLSLSLHLGNRRQRGLVSCVLTIATMSSEARSREKCMWSTCKGREKCVWARGTRQGMWEGLSNGQVIVKFFNLWWNGEMYTRVVFVLQHLVLYLVWLLTDKLDNWRRLSWAITSCEGWRTLRSNVWSV
jgi:hypothetical protein